MLASPFQPMFSELWGFVKKLLTEFPQLERLTESATRLIKHIMKIVPDLFEHRLQNCLEIIINNYEQFPCSAHLYTVEFCLKQYAHLPNLDPVFAQAFEILI